MSLQILLYSCIIDQLLLPRWLTLHHDNVTISLLDHLVFAGAEFFPLLYYKALSLGLLIFRQFHCGISGHLELSLLLALTCFFDREVDRLCALSEQFHLW